MTIEKTALLADRGVVRVAGADAEKLLQDVVTNDVQLPPSAHGAVFAALLTPQGKVLFDFFVARHGGAYLLEAAAETTAQLVKRLAMYRLRARVDISDDSQKFQVFAAWTASAPASGGVEAMPRLRDPRLPGLGMRILMGPAAPAADDLADVNATAAEYHAHRIALGVPEGGKDYTFGDAFPHEANFDLLNGVSFTKGCFVGQEVVSRMQHRGTARKRIVILEAAAPLQPGAEIAAGAATIGTVGSVAGNRALALVRLDRAEEAKAKGEPLTAGGVAVAVRLPDYMKSAAAAGAS